MSETSNTYEYIVKKQAMLNVDSLNERIAELESANAFLKEQNDSLSYISTAAAKVRDKQNITDLCNFVDVYLLDNGLSLDFTGNNDSGILLYIDGAQVNDENIITPNKNNYSVTGTVSFEWVVEVDAAEEDEAQEIAESLISGANFSFYISHEPDAVTASSIDDYYPNIEVVDIYEN
jgi:hypothetical protein